MDIYGGQTYCLKKRVGIWKSIDVVPVRYGIFSQTFHLTMRFFRFITFISFKWYYMLCQIISLLVWTGLSDKLSIYKVPPYPDKWYCQVLGSLW